MLLRLVHLRNVHLVLCRVVALSAVLLAAGPTRLSAQSATATGAGTEEALVAVSDFSEPTVPVEASGERSAQWSSDAFAAGDYGRSTSPVLPYMLGNQFSHSGSVNFVYQAATNDPNVGPGAAGAVNFNLRSTKVAENNNATPLDRFSVDYSFLNNGDCLTGMSPELAPTGLPSEYYPPYRYVSQSVNHDTNLCTITYEKSFCNQLFSLEARIPFRFGTRSRQNLSAANLLGDTIDSRFLWYVLQLDRTPANTWGTDGWELQDASFILKVALYRDPSRGLLVSGGLQAVAPTAPNGEIRVTDYWSDDLYHVIGRRTRTFDIENRIWTLSPFAACYMTPSERTFFSGFLQFDFPLGSDAVNYSQAYESLYYGPFPDLWLKLNPWLGSPWTASGSFHDPMAMQLDLGLGYWLYQNPRRGWLRGIAPTLELHVLRTLQSKETLQLPGSPNVLMSSYPLMEITPDGYEVERAPTVAPTPRMTLTDMTIGIHTQIGKASTLAAGWTFPLGRGQAEAFDSEVLVKFNHPF